LEQIEKKLPNGAIFYRNDHQQILQNFCGHNKLACLDKNIHFLKFSRAGE